MQFRECPRVVLEQLDEDLERTDTVLATGLDVGADVAKPRAPLSEWPGSAGSRAAQLQLSPEGIAPPYVGEAGEVAVPRAHLHPVLDGQGGEMGIGDEVGGELMGGD